MPGETYYTLKEKATTQAKRAGMSQEAAESYGTARANVSASVAAASPVRPDLQIGTKDDPGFYGGKAKEDGKGIDQLLPKELVGIGGTQIDEVKEDLRKATEERERAQAYKEKQGGVYDPKQGKVVYPESGDSLGLLDKLGDISKGITEYDLTEIPVLSGLKVPPGLMGAFSVFKRPTIKQLRDPNYAAIMLNLMRDKEGNRNQRYTDYWKKWLYKDYDDRGMEEKTELGKEVYEDFDSLEDYLEDIAEIAPGSEAQRRIDPESYYDPELYKSSGEQAAALEGYPEFLTSMGLSPVSSRFANTTGNLEDMASIDITDDMSGPFKQQIFDARAELDRMQHAKDLAGGGGGGAGIMGAVPTPFTDVNNNGILDSLEVAQATTVPAATTTVPAATTTAPTPFDYSRWPSYGPAGGPVPNYVNQGLGQGPHFDYWNQIANAFPGMS